MSAENERSKAATELIRGLGIVPIDGNTHSGYAMFYDGSSYDSDDLVEGMFNEIVRLREELKEV